MKLLKRIGLVGVLIGSALMASPLSAQAAPSEYWQNGVRYLVITNVSNYILRCRILDSAGYWFEATIGPTERIWKPVHPVNAAQWSCVIVG